MIRRPTYGSKRTIQYSGNGKAASDILAMRCPIVLFGTRGRDVTDAESWRKRAAELRQSARATREAERERVLLVLAEDCEELAEELERTMDQGNAVSNR